MSKFTRAERQFIKSIVASASLKRLTDNEVIEEIQKHIPDKEPVRREYLYSIRKSIKKDSFNWYNKLREGKYDYIHEYKERINEILSLQKMHHEIIENNKHNPAIQQTSLAELHRLSVTLSNFYDVASDIVIHATIPKISKDTTIQPSRENITV